MMTKKEIRESIKITLTDFSRRDPRGGCWQFITVHHPELWRDHQAALREIDAGYQSKSASRVIAAKGRALDTFNQMVQAWQERDQCKQQELI